jgi:hypothetical protein
MVDVFWNANVEIGRPPVVTMFPFGMKSACVVWYPAARDLSGREL